MDFDILTIAGPTAVGKTEISLILAKKLGMEIVSADAFQVYCYMNIGTAKLEIGKRIDPCHHMIDVCLPSENFSVAQYKTMAEKCLEGIFKRNRKALVVGGTPLYLTALLFNVEIPPENKIPGLREKLIRKYMENPEFLVNYLKEKDPESLNILDVRNARRLIRAIELIEQAGVKYSELYNRWKKRKPVYNSLNLWLYREREEIYEAIEKRVDRMIQEGFIDEVRELKNRFNLSLTAKQAIGYREILEFLEGKMSLKEAVKEIKKRTRRYAKRQLSWFKNDASFLPVDISGLSAGEAAEKILNRFILS